MIPLSQTNPNEMRTPSSAILAVFTIFLLHVSITASDPAQESFLQCLSDHSQSSQSPPISSVTYFPNNSSYTTVLQSYIRNLRFMSPTTPKPFLIVTPTQVSHIQASIICSKIHGLEIRIRSGGQDYDGLSYISDNPFIILTFQFFLLMMGLTVGGILERRAAVDQRVNTKPFEIVLCSIIIG